MTVSTFQLYRNKLFMPFCCREKLRFLKLQDLRENPVVLTHPLWCCTVWWPPPHSSFMVASQELCASCRLEDHTSQHQQQVFCNSYCLRLAELMLLLKLWLPKSIWKGKITPVLWGITSPYHSPGCECWVQKVFKSSFSPPHTLLHKWLCFRSCALDLASLIDFSIYMG